MYFCLFNIFNTMSHLFILFFIVLAAKTDCYLVRQELCLDEYPEAVCNDGSPAEFYHTPSNTPYDTSKYLIHLQGGFFCNSVESCEDRCINEPHYCTTTKEPTMHLEGMFSDNAAQNPTFASFYKVFLHYCSSDMHIGNSGPTSDNGGFYFKGRSVVAAVVDTLKKIGLSEGAQLVLSGTSAGGRGVAFNCEYVTSLLPGVDVRCIIDAAIFYPIFEENPFDKDCKSFNELMRESLEFYNASIKSFDVDTWWETFPLPLFINIQGFDSYAVMYFCIDKENDEHLLTWTKGMNEAAKSLVEKAPHIGLYIPGCFGHPMLRFDKWWTDTEVGKGQLTLQEAVTNWLNNDGPIHAWDDCVSEPRACNVGC